MPFGGARQLTPAQAMIAKLPVDGETSSCSAMAWGFDPYLSEKDPYTGAYIAVVQSVSKLVASGMGHAAYLSLQEYSSACARSPSVGASPSPRCWARWTRSWRWGAAAIGGKDSMSGSFEDLDVPPTLVSFAVTPGRTAAAVTGELKRAGSRLAYFSADRWTAGPCSRSMSSSSA